MILYVLTSTVVLVVLHYARNALRRGLRNLPGPFGAKFTSLWRVSITYKGNGVENYRKLHEKYGKIVRTGPNHVAVSDPAMIPLIYGIASKFRKVPCCPPCLISIKTVSTDWGVKVTILPGISPLLRGGAVRQYLHRS